MNKTKLCVLFGGASSEYEVSLKSAYSVLANADPEKYEIVTVGITKDGVWYYYTGDFDSIKDGSWVNFPSKRVFLSPSKDDKCLFTEDGCRISIDVAWPAMHGQNCEDGRIQGLFELADIPFVGPGCRASAVCMDKASTKLYLENFAIPQAKAVVALALDYKKNSAAIIEKAEKLGYPLFVKPCGTGSSVGVMKAEDRKNLEIAVENAFKFDQKILIEEFISGKEVEVAVIGNEDPIAPTCGEIDPGFEFYDYDTKYNNDTAKYFIPARISQNAQKTVRELAVKIYTALGCKGLSRVDFFVDGERIIFNEINTLPGFTDISMYPKMMMASGLSYAQIIDRLVELAKG